MDNVATRLTLLGKRCFFPQFSPSGTTIVFTSGSRIYRMNVDGSDLKCLTPDEGQFHEPMFSPDGSKIAYVAGPRMYEEIHDIWVMDADGTNPRALTSTHLDSRARWSLDGTSIAFVSGRDKLLEIYRMRPDGSAQTRLTFTDAWQGPRAGTPPRNLSPRYLADDGIVFVSSFWARPEITEDSLARKERKLCLIRKDDSGPKLFVDADFCGDDVVVSNDGRWVTFSSRTGEPGEHSQFCVVRADGSDLKTFPSIVAQYPAFHPAGDRIVFTSALDRKVERVSSNYDLYCVRLDDGYIERLTDNIVIDTLPAFRPDGKQIAFCSEHDGTIEIYSMPYGD